MLDPREIGAAAEEAVCSSLMEIHETVARLAMAGGTPADAAEALGQGRDIDFASAELDTAASAWDELRQLKAERKAAREHLRALGLHVASKVAVAVLRAMLDGAMTDLGGKK